MIFLLFFDIFKKSSFFLIKNIAYKSPIYYCILSLSRTLKGQRKIVLLSDVLLKQSIYAEMEVFLKSS